MIARSGVGQPWLIHRLIAEMRGEKYVLPSANEIGVIFIEHVEGLVKLLGNEKFAILQARKFAKYYARNLAKKMEFCAAMNVCTQLSELKKICCHYFV